MGSTHMVIHPEILESIISRNSTSMICRSTGRLNSRQNTTTNDVESISGWITMWVDPMIYVKMTAIGITAYAVVAVLEFRRIRHVPMDEALKNVE